MATVSILSVASLLLGLAMMILPLALLVVLQVWLCKQKSRWLGLILPVLSLLISLTLVFSVAAFGIVGSGSLQLTEIAEDGTVIEHHVEDHSTKTEFGPKTMAQVGGLFLVGNIPTVVFGGIWLHYKNRRDFNDEWKKMSIKDLE